MTDSIPPTTPVEGSAADLLAALDRIGEAVTDLGEQRNFLLGALMTIHQGASLRGDDIESVSFALADAVSEYVEKWPTR